MVGWDKFVGMTSAPVTTSEKVEGLGYIHSWLCQKVPSVFAYLMLGRLVM